MTTEIESGTGVPPVKRAQDVRTTVRLILSVVRGRDARATCHALIEKSARVRYLEGA